MNAKKTLSLLIVLVVAFQLSAQNFEGKIVYQSTFKSNSPNVTDEQIKSMMGEKQEYYIKDGNYKSVLNGQMIQWQLYINKDNKLYAKTAMSPVIYWNDGAENPNKIEKSELNKGVTEILGYKCDELVLTGSHGTQKFYFSQKLGVDASLFANHKFGNWDEYMAKAKAVPLKIVYETKQFSMESVATEVTPQKLEDSFFALPEGSTLQKSPFGGN